MPMGAIIVIPRQGETTRMKPIEGLPEGIEVVRIGNPRPGDIEILRHEEEFYYQTALDRGHTSTAQVIVKAIEGYELRPKRQFDIRTYESVEIQGAFTLVKILDEPQEIVATLKFRCETQQDADAIEERLADVRRLPGYVEG